MASSKENLNRDSDSLVALLTAQCAELENLLSLARQETLAAKEGCFTKLLDIVSERSKIGRKLETYHQQVAELRSKLESRGDDPGKFDITGRVIELANLTLIQDQETRMLLAETREQTAVEMRDLDRSQSGANAYTRQPTRGLSYDRSF